MIESPLIQEIEERARQQTLRAAILRALKVRFGKVVEEVEAGVQLFVNEEQLNRLLEFAVVCPDARAFQERLRSEPPRPVDAPKSKRRGRKR